MLALHPRRQHIQQPYTTSTLPSPPPSQSSLLYATTSYNTSPSHTNSDASLLHSYLESLQPFQSESAVDPSQADQYMSAFDFANPAIRIQQSTPMPQLPNYSQSSMLPSHSASTLNNWNSYESNGQVGTTLSLQTPVHRAHRQHQRAASSSSIGSNGSQYHTAGHATSYPYVANSENSPSASSNPKSDSAFGADESRFSNHLPTPSHTPTQDHFLNPNFGSYSQSSNMDSTMSAHMSMKQALLDQHNPEEDNPGFGHSGRHSVSSYGQDSPATPHTAHGEDFEDKFKVPPTDTRHNVPKFDQLADMGLTDLYNPSLTAQMVSAPQPNPSMLSPYRNVVTERLQAAQNARSQSPASSSRGVSPFRHGSPYAAPSNSFSPQHTRVGTAAHQREVAKAESDAHALKRSLNKNIADAQPTTISPKDALLDYHEADEESKAPLFPDGGANDYDNQYADADQYHSMATQPQYDTSAQQNYRQQSWATPRFSPPQNFATSGPAPPQTNFSYAAPPIPGNMHALPFHSQQYRQVNSMATTSELPDFPAHLTSMESSASEAGPETSSTASDRLTKPASSAADSGTYTCTYHGCKLRFDTPQKLQKHKREGHRQNPAASSSPTVVGSGMTSAALLERNSQAGPHKCERINPTTGKPCNTIFSRPYDLTRHEDTIHNSRKQKVRCALCVEEKSFSRNDALTRHMRVVHPEVDFPGKHRRRGGSHD